MHENSDFSLFPRDSLQLKKKKSKKNYLNSQENFPEIKNGEKNQIFKMPLLFSK